MLGLKALAAFVHQAENLIMKLRDGELEYVPNHGQLLLSIQSLLHKWIYNIPADRAYCPPTESLEFLIK